MKSYTEIILDYIKTPNIELHHYSTINSTNTVLKQRALEGSKEGLVVIADSQTDGRGRFYRKFYSPYDSGIYMSILLRPDYTGFDATLITSAAATAVAKAVENLSGKQAKIKWVNDVLIENKKVCGILTEGCINPQNGKHEFVIVGIGINAFPPIGGFEEEIKNIAGAVFPAFNLNLKAELTANVIDEFMNYYKRLTEKEFIKEYVNRSCVIGKDITVLKNCSEFRARALSIDDNCRLLVEYPDNSQEYLSSGEISIKI